MKRILFILFIIPSLLFGQSLSITNGKYEFSSVSINNKVKTEWTWVAFGDSFTSTASYYLDDVEERIIFDRVINCGYSAQTLSYMYDRLVDSLTADPTWLDNVNILTVQFGHNDFKDVKNITLGGIDDTVNRPSISGKLKAFFKEVYTANDDVLIYVITPLQRFTQDTVNANGWGVRDLSDTVNAVCDIYGVNCIDWTKDSGVNIWTISAYLSGDHPNSAGGLRLSDMIVDYFLKEY